MKSLRTQTWWALVRKHSPQVPESGMLHVLEMLLLPPCHRAQVQRPGGVKSRERGQICAAERIFCRQREKEGLEMIKQRIKR